MDSKIKHYSKIEWLTENPYGLKSRVWNMIEGCQKVSGGCAYCWSEKEVSIRSQNPKMTRFHGIIERGGWNGKINIISKDIDKPLHWREPSMIFVCSRSDLFHEKVKNNLLFDISIVIDRAPQHQYIILTKRPERIKEVSYLKGFSGGNVLWGVSCENQDTADERIPILLQAPASKRILSLEPLLGRIDIQQSIKLSQGAFGYTKGFGYTNIPDWVIIGAESIGGRAGRECKIEWVESIVEQCQDAGVPVFVKQLHIDGNLVKDIDKFPKHLQIREYPKGGE